MVDVLPAGAVFFPAPQVTNLGDDGLDGSDTFAIVMWVSGVTANLPLNTVSRATGATATIVANVSQSK